MKKIKVITVLTVAVFLVLALAGCSSSNNATAEIVTQSLSGSKTAYYDAQMAVNHPVKVQAAKGEIVKIHFKCTNCGHDESEEIEAPFAKVYNCDCEDKQFVSINAMDYTAEEKEEGDDS